MYIFFIATLVVVAVLLVSLIALFKTKHKLELQNKRYEALSNISNEYLFEFHIQSQEVQLAERSQKLFAAPELREQAIQILQNRLNLCQGACSKELLELRLDNEQVAYFKAVCSTIPDPRGNASLIVGKLVDVTLEVAERNELLVKSQIDGLTGLYNAETSKQLIMDQIRSKPQGQLDALILVDCDNFKNVNDTLGHLAGNALLQSVAESLQATFRSSDIMGRIGGDEFVVYLKDVPSAEFVLQRCNQIKITRSPNLKGMRPTLSMGIALVKAKEAYDAIFNKADTALYQAKRQGKDQVSLYLGATG